MWSVEAIDFLMNDILTEDAEFAVHRAVPTCTKDALHMSFCSPGPHDHGSAEHARCQLKNNNVAKQMMYCILTISQSL